MGECMFLYGTLLPEHAPAGVRELTRRLREIGPATVCGCLYDLGAYPGAVVAEGTSDCIHGRMFELPDDAGATLAALDEYEGYSPAQPSGSLFIRTRCAATLADGRELACWVYVYKRDLSSARRIDGGAYEGRTRRA